MLERYKKPFVITASLAALGGAATKGAEAAPVRQATTPAAHIEQHNKIKFPQLVPEGVRVLDSDAAIQQENLDAYNHCHEQWHGAIVLHKPKKFATVQWTKSPSAYAHPIQWETDWLTVNPGDQKAITVIDPGICNYNGRVYAAVYNELSGEWGWLDVLYGEETGALTAYAVKGQPTGPYRPANGRIFPILISDVAHAKSNPNAYGNKPFGVISMEKVYTLVPTSAKPRP